MAERRQHDRPGGTADRPRHGGAGKTKGMGRGLAAILAASPHGDPEELREVALELIVPNPNQPRRSFGEQALVALADSIKIRGILQPVLLRPLAGGRYELIAGERRWRAAQIAGLERVPAVVRHHDDAASLEVALVENMVREDLNPVEEARACAALVEELGLTREEVGLRVGRSRVAVSNLLRLLDLPDEALDLLARGDLSEGHGRALLLAEDHAARRLLARQAAAGRWSVRELEARARAIGGESRPGARARRAAAGRTAAAAATGSAPHPDQVAAAAEVEDALSAALGATVCVRVTTGGYTAELSFASADEALALARRVQGGGRGSSRRGA